MSPRCTTRHLYFWWFVSDSSFFKWQMSISEAKWTFTPFVLASSITLFLLLTFVKFHTRICSNFSHSLSTAAFAAGIFTAWGIRINLNQTAILQWFVLLSCNVVFMMIRWRFSHTQSCGFTGFQETRKFWFEIVGLTTGPSILTLLACLAMQSGSQWCFQILANILNGLLEIHSS